MQYLYVLSTRTSYLALNHSYFFYTKVAKRLQCIEVNFTSGSSRVIRPSFPRFCKNSTQRKTFSWKKRNNPNNVGRMHYALGTQELSPDSKVAKNALIFKTMPCIELLDSIRHADVLSELKSFFYCDIYSEWFHATIIVRTVTSYCRKQN